MTLQNKRADELTVHDILNLVADEVPEGDQIEFKKTLPAKKGNDPWLDGGAIGDYARNKILTEVVAFANAHGGAVVIGIQESEDHPHRAAGISPVPRCAELADRLRLQCRDMIEPEIPLLEVVGIPTDEDGGGVVVIRTQRSRMGPHRNNATLECYARRADRSEKLGMREIQDLTLQLDRGVAAIEARFEERRSAFNVMAKAFMLHHERAYCVRITMIPIQPLYIDTVHNNQDVTPTFVTLDGCFDNGAVAKMKFPANDFRERPILRGALRTTDVERDRVASTEAHCDGLIEYIFKIRDVDQDRFKIYPGWITALVGSAMCAAEKFRRAAGAPSVEYGMEVEIRNAYGQLPIGGYFNDAFHEGNGVVPEGTTRLPRYSVGPVEEFGPLVEIVDADFWNSAGEVATSYTVDFTSAFIQLGWMEAPAQ